MFHYDLNQESELSIFFYSEIVFLNLRLIPNQVIFVPVDICTCRYELQYGERRQKTEEELVAEIQLLQSQVWSQYGTNHYNDEAMEN